jgi:hypothetical protein
MSPIEMLTHGAGYRYVVSAELRSYAVGDKNSVDVEAILSEMNDNQYGSSLFKVRP